MLAIELENEIVQRLVETLDPVRIILFGSHAWGTPDTDSDVDLLIIIDDDVSNKRLVSIEAHRCLRGLGIPKDIIVRTESEFQRKSRVFSSLEGESLERGRVLYGSGEIKVRPLPELTGKGQSRGASPSISSDAVSPRVDATAPLGRRCVQPTCDGGIEWPRS